LSTPSVPHCVGQSTGSALDFSDPFRCRLVAIVFIPFPCLSDLVIVVVVLASVVSTLLLSHRIGLWDVQGLAFRTSLIYEFCRSIRRVVVFECYLEFRAFCIVRWYCKFGDNLEFEL
jgi:hypothetical protein